LVLRSSHLEVPPLRPGMYLALTLWNTHHAALGYAHA
jgi:hypothetical protein